MGGRAEVKQRNGCSVQSLENFWLYSSEGQAGGNFSTGAESEEDAGSNVQWAPLTLSRSTLRAARLVNSNTKAPLVTGRISAQLHTHRFKGPLPPPSHWSSWPGFQRSSAPWGLVQVPAGRQRNCRKAGSASEGYALGNLTLWVAKRIPK